MGSVEPAPETEGSPRLRWAAAAIAFGVVAVFAGRAFLVALETPPNLEGELPAATAKASAAARPPPGPPRCAEVSPAEGFTIGEPSKRKPREGGGGNGPAGSPAEPPEEEDLSPFAVELGRGTTFDGGFAVGALRDAEGGTVANVVTIGLDGRGGQLVRLARSRGDSDAPVVAGHGRSVIAGMLEPNAGGRALKIAKVTGTDVMWGIELAQGRDESLAFDLAAGKDRAVAVWDDVTKDRERSNVLLATFDPETLQSMSAPRPVSPPKTDAESPRVVARPGGFWLAYVARGEAEARPRGKDDPRGKTTSKAPKKGADEIDEESGGEAIGTAWIEIVPLDESGTPTSTPRRATPGSGHVLVFDLELGDDGGAILAWRDDDTPTGSAGGDLRAELVALGGVGEARILADEGLGTGAPDLLPGWLSIADASGPRRLAALSGKGELVDALVAEPSLGLGDPIAARGDVLLVARPAGKAMRLAAVRCGAAAPAK